MIAAKFIVSNQDYKKCPEPTKPEYAFIGRSNVGKSSLINMLANNNQLAKTSSTPGKTQLINHFIINNEWYLVDLPGYGFAKLAKTIREKWQHMINNYLLHRPNLLCTFVLVDSRHAPQKNDLDFMSWMAEHELPFVIVFTKADKNSFNELNKHLAKYKQVMLESWDELPQMFLTSAEKKIGTDELLAFIEETNMLFAMSKHS